MSIRSFRGLEWRSDLSQEVPENSARSLKNLQCNQQVLGRNEDFWHKYPPSISAVSRFTRGKKSTSWAASWYCPVEQNIFEDIQTNLANISWLVSALRCKLFLVWPELSSRWIKKRTIWAFGDSFPRWLVNHFSSIQRSCDLWDV